MTLLTILIGLITAVEVVTLALNLYDRRRLRISNERARFEADRAEAIRKSRESAKQAYQNAWLADIAEAARRKKLAETGSTGGPLVI